MSTIMNKRNFLKLSASAFASASTLSFMNSAKAQSTIKPNIVFIIADDMGWSDIGYNNPAIKTPNLDKLASSGVKLTHHYAMPTCTPTRIGIMTGHFPSRYGVYGPDYGKLMHEDTVTLPHALQQAGYKTAISGKWHMGSPPEYTPLKYGFDSSYGYFAGQIDPYTHLYKTGIKSWHRNDEYLEEEGHATDLITDEAIRVIQESSDDPFFLYVAYSVPHFPLDEPEEWTTLYPNIKEPSRQQFNASVTHMDDGIGQIVKSIDEKGIRENTIIVFVSDNGGQKSWHSTDQYKGRYADKPHTVLGDNTPLRGWKGDVYEGGIRVPAFVNWQDHISPGECRIPIHIADWMPTLCAPSNSTPTQDLQWDGVNVWNNIATGDTTEPSRPLYWRTPRMDAIRQGDWKLIQNRDGRNIKLYNVKNDPLEKHEIHEQEKDQLNRLQSLLQEQMKRDKPRNG